VFTSLPKRVLTIAWRTGRALCHLTITVRVADCGETSGMRASPTPARIALLSGIASWQHELSRDEPAEVVISRLSLDRCITGDEEISKDIKTGRAQGESRRIFWTSWSFQSANSFLCQNCPDASTARKRLIEIKDNSLFISRLSRRAPSTARP
jgi:hypothetical protein